jgi:hypothetical protein
MSSFGLQHSALSGLNQHIITANQYRLNSFPVSPRLSDDHPDYQMIFDTSLGLALDTPSGSLFQVIANGLTLISSNSLVQVSRTAGSEINKLQLRNELTHMLKIFFILNQCEP